MFISRRCAEATSSEYVRAHRTCYVLCNGAYVTVLTNKLYFKQLYSRTLYLVDMYSYYVDNNYRWPQVSTFTSIFISTVCLYPHPYPYLWIYIYMCIYIHISISRSISISISIYLHLVGNNGY